MSGALSSTNNSLKDLSQKGNYTQRFTKKITHLVIMKNPELSTFWLKKERREKREYY